LAPIVARPEDARVPDATRSELRRLAARYGLVACVTGRTGEVARAIVGVPELTYVGEHGLELDPEAEAWRQRIRSFGAHAPWPVEEKPLSAAFHYRTATDRAAAKQQLEQVESDARAEGFRTRWGRLVLEVLPPIEASKRTAVEHLLARTNLRRALYAGDDTAELHAFAALHALQLAVPVALAWAGAPRARRQRADVVLDAPAARAALLAHL